MTTDGSGDAASGGGSSPGKPTWVGRDEQGESYAGPGGKSPPAIKDANGEQLAHMLLPKSNDEFIAAIFGNEPDAPRPWVTSFKGDPKTPRPGQWLGQPWRG